jgi:hypothetical protein
MAPSHKHDDDEAHDVLAAEEFGVPAIDPRLHEAKPHDILAAEEYGVPAPDPAIHHGPVALPDDPTGIAEAHDVLAAEEFALPVGRHPAPVDAPSGARRALPGGLLVAGALALVVALRARRRRG